MSVVKGNFALKSFEATLMRYISKYPHPVYHCAKEIRFRFSEPCKIVAFLLLSGPSVYVLGAKTRLSSTSLFCVSACEKTAMICMWLFL
jgi:hypothetical protein